MLKDIFHLKYNNEREIKHHTDIHNKNIDEIMKKHQHIADFEHKHGFWDEGDYLKEKPEIIKEYEDML
jgi:hypothetical protein